MGNKKLVAESIFIKEALKKKLSLQEFLLLLYFDNSFEGAFDSKTISKVLSMSEEEVVTNYASLIEKKIINIKAEKDGYGKLIEKVSLDNFYKDIKNDKKESEKEDEKMDIFHVFEDNFGRTLSSMDYEIINAWIDKGFSEELIIAALKEAVYNGVANLRYIDKVLYEWNRKGIKTPEEVNNKMINDDVELYETSVLNFDWLNEK